MTYGVDSAAHVQGFFLALGVGFLAGALWDLLRLLRRGGLNGKFAVAVQDFLFFVLFWLATFLLAYGANLGRIRLYMLLGEAAGFVCWFFGKGLSGK